MWRIHIAVIEVWPSVYLLRACCVFRSDWLGVSIKLTLKRALIMICVCPSWEYFGRHPPVATAASAIQNNVCDWQVFSTLCSANCLRLSRVCWCVILWQNCAGNRLKSNKIMRIKMLAALDKTNPSTGIIRELTWAAVKHTSVKWLSCHCSKS